jgi:mRNA interferase MazF
MRVRRGDVVMVDWPFSDRTGSKKRPALVVQADTLNQAIADTIIVAITSQPPRASATQLFIDISTTDGQLTGLKFNSTLRCENVLTVDCKFIYRGRGRFSATLMRQTNDCLKAALELP